MLGAAGVPAGTCCEAVAGWEPTADQSDLDSARSELFVLWGGLCFPTRPPYYDGLQPPAQDAFEEHDGGSSSDSGGGGDGDWPFSDSDGEG